MLESIILTLKKWNKKYKRIAIIHKDEQKAIRLSEYLESEYSNKVVYVSPEQDVPNKYISVLASYYSKGMEFDAVILANVKMLRTFQKMISMHVYYMSF